MKQRSRMHRRHTENRFCKKLGPHTVDAVTITLRDFSENSGRGPTVDIPFVKTKKQDYLQKYSG